MKFAVHNIEGGATGREIELPEDIFGIEPHEHAVYLDVKAYQANQRQGTHAAKERGQVAGSTRKIKRQKGTGTARAGDIKNPLFRGGGRVFGPRPRKYVQKVNKKVKRLARKSALSSKVAAGELLMIEDFSYDAPKTAAYRKLLADLKQSGKKTLLVTADLEREIYQSCRNIAQNKVVRAQDLNTYDILYADTILLSEGAVEKIKESFA